MHKPNKENREKVEMLSQFGVPQADIARMIGVTAPTLRKYYADEIASGVTVANLRVAKTLFEQATNEEKPSVSACIFWLKTRAGWRTTEPDYEKKPGKKEQEERAATDAQKGTDWDGLLQPETTLQ